MGETGRAGDPGPVGETGRHILVLREYLVALVYTWSIWSSG